MPVVEFVWWSGSDEFLADLDGLFKPTIDYVSKADGCLRIFSGLEAEPNETNFWMVVVWESHELHQAMMARQDYPEMVGGLKPFFRDGKLKMNHVKFNRDTDAAFKAPITATTFITLKENTIFEDVDKVLNVTQRSSNPDKGGRPPTAWGKTEEDARQMILVAGWDSIWARKAALHVEKAEKDSSTMLEINKGADVQVVYLKLKEHFSRA